MADRDPLIYMPIRRATLLRLATRPPPSAVWDLFASDLSWRELGASLTLTAESLMASPEPSDHTHSPPASSSPTLCASSSRANSLAPSELPPSDDDDELPILMDVGTELDEPNLNLESLPYMPDIDNRSDLSGLEKERIKAQRLRGGWGEPNCPRAGDRVPLRRELLRGEMQAGLPMVEGPGGPEPEEEDYGRELTGIGGHGDSGVGDGGKTAGGRDRGEEEEEGEYEDEGEFEVDESAEDERALPRKRKRRKNDPTEWLTVVRKKRTRKEATSLIASISAISTQRHQGDLIDLINRISNTPNQLPEIHPTGSSPPHVLFALARQYEFIALDTKVFDFRRMILLMQMAIIIDW